MADFYTSVYVAGWASTVGPTRTLTSMVTQPAPEPPTSLQIWPRGTSA